MNVAELIASVDAPLQAAFLKYICAKKIERNETEVRKAKKRFLNNTICTIGYEGPDQKTLSERLEHPQTKHADRIKTDIDTTYPSDRGTAHEASRLYPKIRKK